MTKQEIQQYVYNFLYEKGLPHKSICAIMGNITRESNFNPSIVEVGTGAGFGLCQWTDTKYSKRRSQLEAYGTDLKHQCEFLWSELTGENTNVTGANLQWISNPADSVNPDTSYRFTLDKFLKANGTIEELTGAFCYCWERPAYSTNGLSSVRIPNAITFSNTMRYTGTGTTPPPTIPDKPDTPDPEPEEPDEPDPDEPEPPSYEVWNDLVSSAYNLKQLSNEQIEFIQSLSFDDEVSVKNTFNRNKRQFGYNFTGSRLTMVHKTYTIKSVEANGFFKLQHGENGIPVYINPIFILETT